MQLVIADTGPINYLILIGHIDILPALFRKVILPAAVRAELDDAPPAVRDWIAAPPSWVEIRDTHDAHDPDLEKLDVAKRLRLPWQLSFMPIFC